MLVFLFYVCDTHIPSTSLAFTCFVRCDNLGSNVVIEFVFILRGRVNRFCGMSRPMQWLRFEMSYDEVWNELCWDKIRERCRCYAVNQERREERASQWHTHTFRRPLLWSASFFGAKYRFCNRTTCDAWRIYIYIYISMYVYTYYT